MTVKDLKDILDKYPDDMEVIETRCSDYDMMKAENWFIVKAINCLSKRGYIMRAPSDWRFNTQYKDRPEYIDIKDCEEKEYLHFKGN